MKQTNIYGYYCFGYNYHLWKRGFKGKRCSYVQESLEEYLETIGKLELQVTSQIVSKLDEAVSVLSEKGDQKIDDEFAEMIEGVIDGADKTLDAELQLKKVLVVTPKRFNQDVLLEDPQKLLGKGVGKYMSSNARHDFSFAARCIAMSLSTAAAFHLMRCVEEMVKQLYFCYVRQNRLKKPMWGTVLEKLRNKNRPRPSSELIDHLDILRKNFRNPTQHPDKFYSIDEAQDLMNSAIVAINMIANSIEEREPV